MVFEFVLLALPSYDDGTAAETRRGIDAPYSLDRGTGVGGCLRYGAGPGCSARQLSAFSIEPAAVSSDSSPANVTVHFNLTGKAAGIVSFETAFVDPSGTFIQRASKLLAPVLSLSGSVTVIEDDHHLESTVQNDGIGFNPMGTIAKT